MSEIRKRRLNPLGILILLALAGRARADGSPAELNLVPRPVMATSSPGVFHLSRATRIVAVDEDSRRIASQFNEMLLAQIGLKLPWVRKAPAHGSFIRFGSGGPRLPAEGYRLVIDSDRIRIAGRGAGLFYGMQTLAQLLPAGQAQSIELPNIDITDYPRFGYRGLLIDVGRHFYPVTYIKKLLDLAARYKINRFQWHLTDNEGWRIEIKKYPRLTEPVPGGSDAGARRYYTQAEVRDILNYAKARFITVIPEIEMPGHSGAAVAAYSQLACPGGDPEVLCPTEGTFKFVQEVLAEVAALFPSRYLHIGGDEVDKKGWRTSATAQAIMRQQGLKDEEQLQSYFVKRVGKFLASRGKQMIGWDEIMEGGLAPDAVVMSWRGESGGVEAARLGHRVIMAPTEYTYFDYNQGDADREPKNIGGFLPLKRAYGYDPMPQQLPVDKRHWVLGAQANVWTEYIATPEYLEYMLFPRLLAFSEAVWSPAAGRNYQNFRTRLPSQLHRLDLLGVQYRMPEPDGLQDFYTTKEDGARVELASLVPGSVMHYTLDGSEPSATSPRYDAPFNVALTPGRKMVMKLIVVAPDGRRSVVYEASFLHRAFIEALGEVSRQPGLEFLLTDARLDSARQVRTQALLSGGVTDSFGLAQFNRAVDYGVSFGGYIEVPDDSYYRFAVESDDGSVLCIDDEVVVDNDGRHAARTLTGHIPLRKGLHRFRLDYFQAGEAATLQVKWAGSEGDLQPLSGTVLSH